MCIFSKNFLFFCFAIVFIANQASSASIEKKQVSAGDSAHSDTSPKEVAIMTKAKLDAFVKTPAYKVLHLNIVFYLLKLSPRVRMQVLGNISEENEERFISSLDHIGMKEIDNELNKITRDESRDTPIAEGIARILIGENLNQERVSNLLAYAIKKGLPHGTLLPSVQSFTNLKVLEDPVHYLAEQVELRTYKLLLIIIKMPTLELHLEEFDPSFLKELRGKAPEPEDSSLDLPESHEKLFDWRWKVIDHLL